MTKLDRSWARDVVEFASKETLRNTLEHALDELDATQKRNEPCLHQDYGWMVLNEGFKKTRFTKTYPALQHQKLNVYASRQHAQARILNETSERVVHVRIEVIDEI